VYKRQTFPASPWTNNEVRDCGCSSCRADLPLVDTRPVAGADMNRYLDFMKGQLSELLSNYGPVGVMWFDAQDIDNPKLGRVEEMVATMRRLQPQVIINDRIGPNNTMYGDYGVHEGTVPGTGTAREWETCMTTNGSWGYNSKDRQWKSAATLVRMLVETTSKNGNLLLNVGPDGEGVIPAACVEQLKEVGQWMAVNQESIRGCGSSGLPKPTWGFITRKEDRLYLHVLKWPKDGRLGVTLKTTVKQAHLLADQGKSALPVERTDDGIVISVPSQASNALDSVIVLTLEP